jgi:Zn-finger nucleic acid-binding protein
VAWPDKCPTCGKSLTKYESDPVMIEVEMCHQVLGVFCDEGHYTFLECM